MGSSAKQILVKEQHVRILFHPWIAEIQIEQQKFSLLHVNTFPKQDGGLNLDAGK